MKTKLYAAVFCMKVEVVKEEMEKRGGQNLINSILENTRLVRG